jgi:hypothetical protein
MVSEPRFAVLGPVRAWLGPVAHGQAPRPVAERGDIAHALHAQDRRHRPSGQRPAPGARVHKVHPGHGQADERLAGPGAGSGNSVQVITSGPPYSATKIACTRDSFHCEPGPARGRGRRTVANVGPRKWTCKSRTLAL